jgi:hypothetical protein
VSGGLVWPELSEKLGVYQHFFILQQKRIPHLISLKNMSKTINK